MNNSFFFVPSLVEVRIYSFFFASIHKKLSSSSFFMLWSRGIDSKEPIPLANIAWAHIFKRLRSPGINSEESIPPAYVTW